MMIKIKGEAMEKGLRECCRSIRIGKILIQAADEESKKKSSVVYAKFPSDINMRKILLMYPIMSKCSFFFYCLSLSHKSGFLKR
jgi:uracil phosphoribosyltransferase